MHRVVGLPRWNPRLIVGESYVTIIGSANDPQAAELGERITAFERLEPEKK